ncbi:uncharacterized protein P174DRAFT_19384 [Aspergillus novofumigatus IBT 16806]|uniref:Uncharacterized protein n=1 Tax=Aspergillus novofumigatus (strain IBT 16806) TaxID=1392255 RepID=A0A2I1CLJ4_ASPN1|nr:uncharacterized protein P174DRAFT_19384 [Aspergillus novofumigatus IBT 16806]PKX98491.1 hypothetical protein P174DRAFT_19384 [Aspergillus novofumigatus IBT 16806]
MTNWSFRKKHPGKQFSQGPSSRNPLGFVGYPRNRPSSSAPRLIQSRKVRANPHESSWKIAILDLLLNQRHERGAKAFSKPRSSTYRTRRQWQIYEITMASHKPHLLSATNFVANSQRLHHSWPGIVVLARNRCIRKNCLLVEFASSRWRPGVKWSRSMASGTIFHRLFGSGWRQSAPEDELLSWAFLPFSSFASSRFLLIPIGNREN